MATIVKRFNAKTGLSVGEAPVNVIDENGNITSVTGSFSSNAQSTNTTTGAVIVTGGVGIGGNLNVGGSVTIGGTFNVTDATFAIVDNGNTTKALQFETANITAGNTRTLTVQDASGTIALLGNRLSAFAATTSAELASVISDETGTGSLVFANSPTLVTPNIGAAAGSSLSVTGQLTSTVATGTAPLVVSSTTKVNNLNADTVDGISIGTIAAAGGVVYATSTTEIAAIGAGIAGQALVSGGAGAPTWRSMGSYDDLTFAIVDNVNNTKVAKFESSGITTGTTRTFTFQDANGTLALLENNLGQFATTTSAQLAGVISDETGSGSLVFNNTPTLLTPVIASVRGDAGALELRPNAANTTGTVTVSATTASTNATTGALVVAGGVGVGGDINITGNTIISGDLTVHGTTTTVNSTVVTIKDPVFALGDDTLDDNKDRGVTFRYNDGVSSKAGFFGFKDSTGEFTFIPDATGVAEVFSGAPGTIAANLNGTALRATNLAGGAAGSIAYQTAPNTTAFLAAGTTGQVLLSGGTGAPTWTNYGTVTDEAFLLTDDLDPTKIVKFQVAGVSTATTRTLTVQNANGTIALLGNNLSAFAATTSAELASVISDETGTGVLVFNNTPTLLTPVIASVRGDAGALELRPNAANTTGTVTVSATTASTNATTGALVVAGGVGVAGALHANSVTTNTVDLGHAVLRSFNTALAVNATNAVVATAVAANFTTYEFTVQARQASGYFRSMKVFAIYNGTDVAVTEYASLDLGTINGTLNFSVVLNGANIELQATQAGATSAFTVKVLAATLDA